MIRPTARWLLSKLHRYIALSCGIVFVLLGLTGTAPAWMLLGANWQWTPAGHVRLQAAHVADRDINIGRKVGTANVEEHFEGYTLVDLAASWDSAYGKLGVGIENLLDRQYIGYYPQSANYKDVGSYFAGRGRTFSVSWTRSF